MISFPLVPSILSLYFEATNGMTRTLPRLKPRLHADFSKSADHINKGKVSQERNGKRVFSATKNGSFLAERLCLKSEEGDLLAKNGFLEEPGGKTTQSRCFQFGKMNDWEIFLIGILKA